MELTKLSMAGFGIIIRRGSISRTPVEAHAFHLDFGSIGNALTRAVNLSLVSGIFSSLQLTVLAHRTYAVRGKRSGKKTRSENAQAKNFNAV